MNTEDGFDLKSAIMGHHEEMGHEDLATAIQDITDVDKLTAIPMILQMIGNLATESEKNYYIDLLSKKTGISKRSLNKDLSVEEQTEYHQKSEKIFSANFPGLIDLAEDDKGQVVFLMNELGALMRYHEREVQGSVLTPPDKAYLPFLLPREAEVFKHYQAGDYASLFNDVLSYLKRFSYQQEGYWLILALKVFLTYLQTIKIYSICR